MAISIRRIILPLAVCCLFLVFREGVSQSKRYIIGIDEYHSSLNHVIWLQTGEPKNLSQTLDSVATISPHHTPLYFILLNFWRSFVGNDLMALRVLSAYIAVLCVAITYRLGALTGESKRGVVAMFFLAFYSFFLFHSHNLRMYTLVPLLSAGVLWFNWWLIQKTGRDRVLAWIALTACSTALIYTHYFGLLIILATMIWNVFATRKVAVVSLSLISAILAGLLFLPWLPTMITGFTQRADLSATQLSLIESILVIFELHSNGLTIFPICALAAYIVLCKILQPADLYWVFVLLFVIGIMIVANEFIPILVERRMRYTAILIVPFALMYATITRVFLALPPQPFRNSKKTIVLFAILALWLIAHSAFTDSHRLIQFTSYNWRSLGFPSPHYLNEFLYELESLPGENESILSFHPQSKLSSWQEVYYHHSLKDWNHLIHISRRDEGDLRVQATPPSHRSLDGVAQNETSLWLVYDPKETDLRLEEDFRNWLYAQYKVCEKYLNDAAFEIEYLVHKEVPCRLSTDEQPLTVEYDNGIVLWNVEYEISPQILTFFLKWQRKVSTKFSLSIQLFDDAGNKVRQVDRVITDNAIEIHELDIAGISDGSYAAKLIVYNFETLESASGTILHNNTRIVRDLHLANITLKS